MMCGTYTILEFHFVAITKWILILGKNLWPSKWLIGPRSEFSPILGLVSGLVLEFWGSSDSGGATENFGQRIYA